MDEKIELARNVRVGAAEAVITDLLSLEYRGRYHGPPRPAGDLLASLLLLSSEEGELLLISLDLLELYEPWLERFHAAMERCTGIPPERQYVWCNHIHASPSSDGVAEIPLAERIAPVVEEARSALLPAEYGFRSRDLGPGWTMNRRFHMGELGAMCVMFNDGCWMKGGRMDVTEQVKKHLAKHGVPEKAWSRRAFCEAPRDVRLEVLSVRGAGDGATVASVVRFPAHAVIASAVIVGNTLFPDFIGAFREALKRRFGGVVLFLQGPSADVRPLHEEYGVEEANAFGKRLAGEAAGLFNRLRYRPMESAAAVRKEAYLPLRPEYQWDEERLKKERAEVEGELGSFSGEPEERMALVRRAEELRWVGFFRCQRPTIISPRALKDGIWAVETAALRFGGVNISALPGEIFQATGEKAAEKAPEKTIVTELYGSYVSYLPSKEDLGSGGYEDTSSFFAAGGEEALLDAVHSAIGALRG